MGNGWSPDAQTSTVFATLTFVAPVGTFFLILFEFLRNKADIYLPRLRSQPHRVVAAPPNYFLAWVPHVLKVSDSEVLKSCGLDSFVLLSFLRLFLKVTTIAGFFGIIILAPVYQSGPSDDGIAGINLYTMANVVQSGHALWASFLFTWIFTLMILYFLHIEYKNFLGYRQDFLRNGDVDNVHPQTSYSVIVENIPLEYRSSDKLKAFFENLFPGKVLFARISVAMKPLTDAIELRKTAVANAESAAAYTIANQLLGEKNLVPTIKLKDEKRVGFFSCGGETVEVNALDYYKKEIVALNMMVERYQSEATTAINAEVLPPDTKILDTDSNEHNARLTAEDALKIVSLGLFGKSTTITKKSVAGTGFVTFSSRCTQATCCQVAMLSQKYPLIKAFPAPEPKEIIWSNISATLRYTEETANITTAAYLFGMGWWTLVLTFISSLSNLESLSEYMPFIDDLDPVLYAIIAGLLPVIFLAIFMFYLPVIMASISKYIERRKTLTAIENEVFSWHFRYQMTSVFFSLLAGSAVNSVADIVDDPGGILNALGDSVPKASVLFINASLFAAMIGVPFFMLRIVALAYFQIYRFSFSEKTLTRRQVLEGALYDEGIVYGAILPGLLYFAIQAMTYWVLAPILECTIAFLFFMLYLAYKYMVLYVYVPQFESGGLFWYGLYKNTMLGLIGSNIVMVIYMSIKVGAAQATLLIPIFFVIYKAWNYTETSFYESSLHFAYSNAVEADAQVHAFTNALQKSYDPDYYMQEEFSAKKIVGLHPYRIDGEPIWTKSGALSPTYYKEAKFSELSAQPEELIYSTSASSATSVGYIPPDQLERTLENPILVSEGVQRNSSL